MHATAKRRAPMCGLARTRRRAAGALAAAAGALLAMLMPADAPRASGYALREQSTTAQGNSFAGATAGSDDLSTMFFNAASLTRLSGSQLALLGTTILPQFSMQRGAASTAAGVPLSGNDGGNAGEIGVVPAFYALWDVQDSFDLDENIKLGVGVNVPFGLATKYRDGWLGRYHALESELRTVNVNPSVAWEALPGVSLAVGLQVQYITARLTNAIDFGTIGAAAGGTPGQNDGDVRLDGDDIAVGWTAGILYEPVAGTRIGVGYRSAVEHDLNGNAEFGLGGPVGQGVSAASGAFQDTGIDAHVTTPESVSLGVYHDLSPEWAVMAQLEWTRWSRFDDLTIKFDNPAQPNSVTDEDWRDTWFVAAGVTWRPTGEWTVRGGVAFDQDPTSNDTRTPRIPTNDRYWLSVGLGWQPLERLAVDFGYTHLFIPDGKIDLKASEPGNRGRGNLSGRTEGAVDLISLQARYVF